MSTLTSPPVDIKPLTQDVKPKHEHLINGDTKPGIRSRESSGSLSPAPASLPIKTKLGLKDEPIDIDDEDDLKPQVKLEDDKVKVEAHKRKYDEEEKKLKDLEPPPVQRLQDDWQVAYVWAFIVKFNQKEKIKGLEAIEDFERSLLEPVAIRPDDVLEGILIQFLKNLRPALRNLSAETIQNQLSNYFNDQLLNSTEFTVWDRAWAANEEVRAGCCNTAEDRMELGRLRYIGEPVNERVGKNPIKKQVDKGGGIFEMDWRDRAKMLRQLVDWQLVHADIIKGAINKEYKIPGAAAKKEAKALPDLLSKDERVKTDCLGYDRDKNRIWSFDNSVRIYKSGNPYKRPCPLIPLTQTRAEFDALAEMYAQHGAKEVVKPEGKGAKGKLTPVQSGQYKKAVKGKEDEGKLAEKLLEMVPAIEKEEARVQRAKKRVEQAANLASMAEWRSTRTRRPTRKVDYTYGDGVEEEVEDDVPASSKRRRGEPQFAHGLDDRGRPIIPGERRSARTSARDDYIADQDDEDDADDQDVKLDNEKDDDGSYSDQEIEAVLPLNGNDDTTRSSIEDSPPPYSAPSESMDVD